MNNNFWEMLPENFFVFAPMDEVTDTVFRRIVATCGRPDIFFTEFTNCDGMVSAGRAKVEQRLRFDKSEHPIVAQIWGKNPESFFKTAGIVRKLGFDGIDINMGCPVADVVKRGECSGLIKTPQLAAELIAATREGAGGIPVSVKTRIGLNTITTHEWIPFLLEQKIDALTVHARTVREQSKVPAHWEEFGKVVEYRNQINPSTKIIANGDIRTRQDAAKIFQTYGVDGVMIGRGIFDNPWVFNKTRTLESITPQEKLKLLMKHIQLFESTWGDTKHFPIMRKFVKAYVNGFDGASDMRVQLMQTESAEELLINVKNLYEQLKKRV